MSQSPELRAGDEDRDRTITRLREAFAEGRLTQDEFDGRMGEAAVARTFSDLDSLTADLPVQPRPSRFRLHRPQTSRPTTTSARNSARAGRPGSGVSVLVNVIWLGTWITGDEGAPAYWPIWVMGPWGAAMLIGTLSRRGR